MLWRLQLVVSFVFLNIFPIASAVLVNGVLFGATQGEEVLQGLWFGHFILDGKYGLSAALQHVVGIFSTLLFASAIWSTSRLLCDVPTRKALARFSRVRADRPDACFVRHVGPVFLAVAAAAPLTVLFAISIWAAIESNLGYMLHPLNRDLFLERALDGLCILLGASLGSFILLYHELGRWKTRLSNAVWVRTATATYTGWRSIAFWLGVSVLPLVLLSLSGNPWIEELNVDSVHGYGYSQVDRSWIKVFMMLALTCVGLFVGRATISRWLTRDFSEPLPHTMRVHAVYTGMIFLFCAVLVAGLWVDSVRVAQAMGFIGVLMVASTFWSILFSVGLVVVPQYFGSPSLALLPVLLSVAFSTHNDNHELHAVTEQKSGFKLFGARGERLQACLAAESKASIEQMDDDLRRWILARINLDTESPADIPLVIASGSGGGIRAARFFAETMAQLDEVTNGSFGDHVFAISTVSGGSLGAALWIKARGVALDRPPDSSDLHFASAIVSRFFLNDYLSPITAGLLIRDAAQQLLPFPLPGGDRALIMEEAWDRGWQQSVEYLNDPTRSPEMADFGMLSQLILAGRSEHPSPPIVIFNSTEAHTGRRFLVANRRIPSSWFPDSYIAISSCTLHGLVDMRLATAAHLSARFTFISPAASIQGLPDPKAWAAISQNIEFSDQSNVSDRPVPWGQIVDGGYYENYGATTAREIAKGIQESFMRLREAQRIPSHARLRLFGLSIVNDPLDLGNVPLDSIHFVNVETYDWMNNKKVGVQSLRFEALSPIEGTYDQREYLGLLGIISPASWLTSKSRLLNELSAPLSSVLQARESRGMTAEREFKEYLASLGRERPMDASLSGTWRDARLGRMLRDTNLLTYSKGDVVFVDRSPRNPSIGDGSYAMPNPGLAWFLSQKSYEGMTKAIRDKPDDPSRYQRYGDIEQIHRAFDAICKKNPRCAKLSKGGG